MRKLVEQSHQELVDEVRELKKALEDPDNLSSPNNIAKLFMEIRDLQDNIAALAKEMKAVYDLARHVTLPAVFKEHETKTVTAYGYRFTVSDLLRASIKGGMKEEAFAWLRDNNLEDLITETVNASTLSAEAKRQIEEGFGLDEDLFNLNYLQTTSMTKVK